MDMTSGEKTSRAPRNAQIDSEKARLRDKPPRNSSLPRRYVSAASPFFSSPFTRTLRSGVCLSPFFTTRETTLRPRAATTVTDAATSAAPTERRASAPRRRNKRGAFPCDAAAAAHPRGPAPRALPTPARQHGRFLPSVYGEGYSGFDGFSAARRPAAACRCASVRRAAARRRCFCNLVRSSRKRLKRLLA